MAQDESPLTGALDGPSSHPRIGSRPSTPRDRWVWGPSHVSRRLGKVIPSITAFGKPAEVSGIRVAVLPALFLRGRGDRPDEVPGPLVVLECDVSLRNHADEPPVLDDGQPPNLVAGHQLECLFEVVVGL